MDFGFFIDGLGSINYYGVGNFRKCLKFVKVFIKVFVIFFIDIRVGVIVFLYYSKFEFDFIYYKM